MICLMAAMVWIQPTSTMKTRRMIFCLIRMGVFSTNLFQSAGAMMKREAWVSGTGDSFTHHRFWSDENGNGIEDAGDQIDYFTSIEKLVIQAGNGMM